MTVITVRPDAKMAKQIEKYAKMHDRSMAYMLKEAWEEYVALKEWQVREVEAGLADMQAGSFMNSKDWERFEAKFGLKK